MWLAGDSATATARKAGARESQPEILPAYIIANKGVVQLKAVFCFTNEYSPEVRTYLGVSKIEVITESDVEKFQITHLVSGSTTVTKIPTANGQIAIFWE